MSGDQRSPNAPTGKRSLFEKLRRKAHGEGGNLRSLPGSQRSLQAPSKATKAPGTDISPAKRNGSIATFDSSSTAKPGDYGETASKSRLHFRHGKRSNHEPHGSRESGRGRNNSVTNQYDLDTDLANMEGIVNSGPQMSSPRELGSISGGQIPIEDFGNEVRERGDSREGAWDAPDSWAVRRAGEENAAKLLEADESGAVPKQEEDTTPHFVRVFRVDSTFATLATQVNATVADLLYMLGKKTFLQDGLDNYQIVMRKHDLQRRLEPGERPIAMQKRLLEQAGYTSTDRLEEVGREDNSYLCRFTFLPTKISGYYSLEQDPGFNKMQKFSHVDLQGRSLVTIPIALYKKASEIISLNLSRNLALDVPKDFIQGCLNLREIKFTGNEARRLPQSLSLASRLTVLDISNNRLEQLDQIELDRCTGLVSIKMANNKLSSLPSYFSKFKSLRSLNISSNSFKQLPSSVLDLKSLVDLDVSFNEISTLAEINNLNTLERLWATNNHLSGNFGEAFQNLANLKEIDVRFNYISNINVVSQLPRLEQLFVGHNRISVFEGSFPKLRILLLDHNPTTRFDLDNTVATLTTLDLASGKLVQLNDTLFEKMPNLTKLILDKNHFSGLSSHIGKLKKLQHLSMLKNPLASIPPTIGCLSELTYLNLRECNLSKIAPELWWCSKLETLNVSSNVLESFPKHGAPLPQQPGEAQAPPANPSTTPDLRHTPSFEELGKLEDFGARRPSQASGGLLSVGSSPASSTRKGSIVSIYGQGGRKASVVSRTPNDVPIPTVTRKDSSLSNRVTTSFAGSLQKLYLADNRLETDVFREIVMLPELRVLNLSYNELSDFPQGSLRRWPHLTELYLSGNELTSLPADDLEESSSLRVLHINDNKFQVLPAELCKVHKLAILDVGSNALKYNVSNWPYDWNWNWNRNLKYLNFSGNKKLEIKPNIAYNTGGNADGTDLTNFSSLPHLRVLGLMDVTLTIPSVPDQTEDRRVRTSASLAGALAYGMADTLGKNEHLSTIDMVVPRFRGNEMETLVGMFDGQTIGSCGSKVAKYLHENFQYVFIEELSRLNRGRGETPSDALRRAFLALNKDLAIAAGQSMDDKEHRLPHMTHRGSTAARLLSHDDLHSGGVATVLYLQNMDLYVANVGDAQAMLLHSDGGFKFLTRKHDPGDDPERQRIREAGGYVSRTGKLNDSLEVSRAFGYFHMMPAVMAAPHTLQITLKEQDEMVLIASREIWDYLTPDFVADVARSERQDLMCASQKLRDLAMAFGASNKIMVMIIGVSDLRKRERNRLRSTSLSMGPSPMQDDQIFPSKRGKRPRDGPGDSRLARLDQEVDAPTGDVAIIFTDIKSSTVLWETFPIAMRTAIRIHNDLMRRQLRIIGGYEVKTEGDAFMVSFRTATAALLWCFSVQSHLLEMPWPSEIMNNVHCQERFDADENIIYRGLSVRMGIHWGRPVCEEDPVTHRMDYFGPMVNRASRISAVADGGEIYVSSDFIGEIQRTLETYAESDRAGSTGSEDTLQDDLVGQAIRKELRQLSSQGFEVKDLGERKLKGLENPEFVYLMYPHSLAGRLAVRNDKNAEEEAAANEPGTLSKNTQLTIDTETVWDLWKVSLRLEMLCSYLESSGTGGLKPPELGLLERMKNRGGEVTDSFLVNFVEHQVSRIEVRSSFCSCTYKGNVSLTATADMYRHSLPPTLTQTFRTGLNGR